MGGGFLPQGKALFRLIPEFPEGNGWVIEILDEFDARQGVIVARNKIEMLQALDHGIDEDEEPFNFETN